MPLVPSSSSATVAPLRESARSTVLGPLLDACGLGWFCLRSEGRREHVAAQNLTRRNGIEAFAPRLRVRRERRSGGVFNTTEALFPGYLFARLRYPDQVRRVVSTTGVLGFVAFGGPPPRLPDDTIAHLQRHGEPAAGAPLAPVFEAGDWVRIAGGCLRGSEGRVRECESGSDRICVLLTLLGHDVVISLPAAQLVGRVDRSLPVPALLRTAGSPRSFATA